MHSENFVNFSLNLELPSQSYRDHDSHSMYQDHQCVLLSSLTQDIGLSGHASFRLVYLEKQVLARFNTQRYMHATRLTRLHSCAAYYDVLA